MSEPTSPDRPGAHRGHAPAAISPGPQAASELYTMSKSISITSDFDLGDTMSDIGLRFADAPVHRIILEITETDVQTLADTYREQIFRAVWESDFMGASNVIDVNVSYLRERLESTGGTRLIQTVRGVGYAIRES